MAGNLGVKNGVQVERVWIELDAAEAPETLAGASRFSSAGREPGADRRVRTLGYVGQRRRTWRWSKSSSRGAPT